MKYNIPQDWNPETGSWKNYCISWPDSIEWDAIFFGFLSSMFRGRTWDEKSGYIKGVQAIGRLIWEKNFDPPGCNNDNLCCEPEWMEVIEQLMPIVSNLKCEDGYLWMERCCQWVKVCELAAITGDVIPDDYPEPDPPPAIPTCYKAGAFSQHFTPWMENIFTFINTNPGETDAFYRDGIAALYPANMWLWDATMTFINVAKQYPATIASMLSDPTFAGHLQCALYNILETYGLPADNANWLLQYNDRVLWDAYLGNTLQYDPHANAYAHHFQRALNFGFMQTTLASYGDQIYDCTGCDEEELSPQSAVTASGWFLTQGYYGSGSQSASGEAYNNVCLADEPDYPYNCWGVVFKLVSTAQTLWPGGASGTTCTGTSISGAGSWSSPQYIARCPASIWAELEAVSGHSYNRSDDGGFNTDNISIPEKNDGDDFMLALRGDYQTDVVDVEATDIRFICNVNNLGI